MEKRGKKWALAVVFHFEYEGLRVSRSSQILGLGMDAYLVMEDNGMDQNDQKHTILPAWSLKEIPLVFIILLYGLLNVLM